MAAIDDLILQVQDEVLRERLKTELAHFTKQKKFGLVFEEHLPELSPIHSSPIRRGNLVASRGNEFTETWRVISVGQNQARCKNRSTGEIVDIAITDLITVREFGDPIFPSLTSVDRIQNGAIDAPWHLLIEADNYHALQLLEYAYVSKVDCIYIDPPYNTGSRDWKYNNDYVGKSDRWRHSKWLAMMRRRLLIAKRLLKPDTGVLIVTIDEHEVHHLRTLLQEILPNAYIQMVTTVINPKGVTQGRFSRVEEYVIYCFMPNAFVGTSDDDLLNPKKTSLKPRWKGLLRSGTNARRADRKNMFYPVLIDPVTMAAIGVGQTLPFEQTPDLDATIDGYLAAWPVRTDGSFGNWGVGYQSLNELIKQGYVAVGKYDPKRKTYAISYISKPNQKRIELGTIEIVGRDEITNVVDIQYADMKNSSIKTVWHRTRHDAGAYGSDLLTKVLKQNRAFSFPKSLYSVVDAVAPIVRDRKEAVILDFFAGSGTTLHAVNLLNELDSGNRSCIMVTNNEVSEEEAKQLTKMGYHIGTDEWEAQGICRSVTWPRSKYTIIGQRDDGSLLEDEYMTGRKITRHRARTFRKIGFIEPTNFDGLMQKRELISLNDKIPTGLIKKDSAFLVSEDEKYTSAILFDDSQEDAFLEALDGMNHITHFFIVTQSSKRFSEIKAQVEELLGPIEIQIDEKRPMRDGFPANLEYFQLDFLEKDNVALGKQFRELLPILWMRAGAVGPRPILDDGKAIPKMLIPEHNPFAILVDETHFAKFRAEISKRNDLTHVFLITDSEEAFQEMAEQMQVPVVIQLYRDYLENFMINKARQI